MEKARVYEQVMDAAGCTLVMENDAVRLVILPEIGGRIYRLMDRQSGRDYLWQHPRIAPRLCPEATDYDAHFFGGWDEQFPNDAPLTYNGCDYPDRSFRLFRGWIGW